MVLEYFDKKIYTYFPQNELNKGSLFFAPSSKSTSTTCANISVEASLATIRSDTQYTTARLLLNFTSFTLLWLTPKEPFRALLQSHCPFEVALLEIHYSSFFSTCKKKCFCRKLSAGSLSGVLKYCFKMLAFITLLNIAEGKACACASTCFLAHFIVMPPTPTPRV